LISVKLHDRLLWTSDSWAGHRRVKNKENLELLFAALPAALIIGYYSKICILQFWMWHVLCFRQRMWVMHNNGWRFLCIDVHRDCSSWKQYWTVWRLEAISSEGLHFMLYSSSGIRCSVYMPEILPAIVSLGWLLLTILILFADRSIFCLLTCLKFCNRSFPLRLVPVVFPLFFSLISSGLVFSGLSYVVTSSKWTKMITCFNRNRYVNQKPWLHFCAPP